LVEVFLEYSENYGLVQQSLCISFWFNAKNSAAFETLNQADQFFLNLATKLP